MRCGVDSSRSFEAGKSELARKRPSLVIDHQFAVILHLLPHCAVLAASVLLGRDGDHSIIAH